MVFLCNIAFVNINQNKCKYDTQLLRDSSFFRVLGGHQTLPIFSMTPHNTTGFSFDKQAMWCMFICRVYLNCEDFSSTLIEFCSGPGCSKHN